MAHQELLACLHSEHAAVNAFIDVLNDESRVLLERAPAAELADVTERKNRIADQIAELGNTRDTLLSGLDFGPGHTGTFAAAASFPEVAPVWQSLLEDAAKAKSLNERNGLLVKTHLRFATQSLAALRAASGNDLYQSNGRQGVSNLGGSRRA